MKYHSELGVLVPERPSDELFIGADRRDSIGRRRCVPAPLGCGLDAREFSDLISWQEYKISGLCQKCQDRVFNEGLDGAPVVRGSEWQGLEGEWQSLPAPTEEDYDEEEADQA